MDRTRPAHLIPGGFAGDEADELEDVGQRDHGPDCGKVNARHGWSLRTESRGIIRAGAARPSSGGNREDSHGGNWSDWVSKAMYGRSLCRRTGDLFICTHGSRWPSGATSVDSRTTSRHSEISGERPHTAVSDVCGPTERHASLRLCASEEITTLFGPSDGRLGENRFP